MELYHNKELIYFYDNWYFYQNYKNKTSSDAFKINYK